MPLYVKYPCLLKRMMHWEHESTLLIFFTYQPSTKFITSTHLMLAHHDEQSLPKTSELSQRLCMFTDCWIIAF